MKVQEMIFVSVDDHVVEPPDMFDGHLASKWRDVAPRVVRREGDREREPQSGDRAAQHRIPSTLL